MDLPSALTAQWDPHRGPMEPHWGPGHGMEAWGNTGAGGLGGADPLLGVLLVVGVALIAAYLVRRRSAGPDAALGVLRERYARGEITDDEYDRRVGRLAGDHTSD